ncbi:tripartite tricarboxylate transporter TctB family protein [Martelella mediterranea]|uniref:Tripartite tricarboxylate transporter TctB family protein n=1 Tax=Martelella mediterranea DSM 17316 TaxID=1122214 RepID=A0A1U9Z4E3_9HYPH|nr:tripartite tricarboxylate transporter TctB family protein [Martelella mediterranea]AQZ52472.1 Tripartite tricarboxylate transporter TctB family protein [Martelella mediterranea DSM 17316]
MLKIRSVDIAVSTILLAVGIAQLIGGYTMDRLEVRHIPPASFPGLLPIVLGIAMTIVAGLQLIGLLRSRDGDDERRASGMVTREELVRLSGLIALCAIYAIVLVGRVHFWVASSLFVATFMLVFELSPGMPRRAMIITILRALVIAILFGGAVSYLFEDLFLVRLP